jgi:hypothetical protein
MSVDMQWVKDEAARIVEVLEMTEVQRVLDMCVVVFAIAVKVEKEDNTE